MTTEIKRGLRKLEFVSSSDSHNEGIVEFIRDSPLPEGETVRVPLGRRDGKLRELAGIPTLLSSSSPQAAKREYLYRLSAGVIEARSERK